MDKLQRDGKDIQGIIRNFSKNILKNVQSVNIVLEVVNIKWMINQILGLVQ